MNVLDTAVLHVQNCSRMAKEKVKEFFTEEKGGAEIIATMVLVAIVVALAVAFRSQLQTLFDTIWADVDVAPAVEDFNVTP